jgi:hypothetical protein
MYCPKCGKENPDDAQLCHSCGSVLMSTPTQSQNADTKTSGLAIASLILGILSAFIITGIAAIILGIVALVKIRKSSGQLKGKGLAVAGIGISIIVLGMATCGFLRLRNITQRIVCQDNLGDLFSAMFIYAIDNDDKFPTPSKWCDLLVEHTKLTKESFRCPSASKGPCNYAINKNVEKLGLNSSPGMVLLFETHPGWNQSGGPEILTTENHNLYIGGRNRGPGCNVLCGDGHAEFIKKEDLKDLQWEPE